MKEIMVVEDAFLTNEVGVVVSGVNSGFDSLEQEEIKKIVGDRVKVVIDEGREFVAQVKDIAISESIVGKKNISIALGELTDVDRELRGSIIYSVE